MTIGGYKEGLVGQQLRLRKAVLAFVSLLDPTCWERYSLAAASVLLVVMVHHSGLIVLQHLIVLFGIFDCFNLQVVHASTIGKNVRFVSITPDACRYVAELLVFFEGGPLLLDDIGCPLVLFGVWVPSVRYQCCSGS